MHFLAGCTDLLEVELHTNRRLFGRDPLMVGPLKVWKDIVWYGATGQVGCIDENLQGEQCKSDTVNVHECFSCLLVLRYASVWNV